MIDVELAENSPYLNYTFGINPHLIIPKIFIGTTHENLGLSESDNEHVKHRLRQAIDDRTIGALNHETMHLIILKVIDFDACTRYEDIEDRIWSEFDQDIL